MSLQELKILRVLLVVARCLGCFPFSMPSFCQAIPPPQTPQTVISISMNGRVSHGFRRSYAWTVWSLVMISYFVTGCSLTFLSDWEAVFTSSYTLRAAQCLTVKGGMLGMTVLLLYLVFHTSSLVSLTASLVEQYYDSCALNGRTWCPQKDCFFLIHHLIVITFLICILFINLYFIMTGCELQKINDSLVMSFLTTCWFMKGVIKAFVVLLLYTTSQLVASLYSRVLSGLGTQQLDHANPDTNDSNIDNLWHPDTIYTCQIQKEITKRLLTLHDTQHLLNNYFSYSVMLVLTDSLASSTACIFYFTSKVEIQPLRTMSFLLTWEALSTIFFICYATDPVQRQVRALCDYVSGV